MVTGSQLDEGVLLWLEMQGVQAGTLKRSNPQVREQDPGEIYFRDFKKIINYKNG